jgi:hypothetical protein
MHGFEHYAIININDLDMIPYEPKPTPPFE